MIPDWVLGAMVVLDVVCAIWVYRDAVSRKTPNPILWSLAVFLGNLFGWIGILYYLVARERRTRRAWQQ